MKELEYIDLGLSVKWATCNLDATSPEETGHRYTFDEKSEVVDVKIPTREQWKELMENCTWEWKNKGVVITGKNGNSIFLPAVGELNTDGLFEVGNAGSYWTSTTMSSNNKYSCYMSFIRKRPLFDWEYKFTKGIYSTFNSSRTLVIRSVQ